MYKNYSRYEVLADGRIWSKHSNKFLKPNTVRGGYQQVDLRDNEGKRHTQYVHIIVYCAVNGLWEIPEGMQINHKNESKTSNEISNLELVTAKQNVNYGTRNERAAKALTNHPDLSKRVAAYNAEGELIMVFPSTMEAQRNGYQHSAVSTCCRNCYLGGNKYKGLFWRYLDDEQ